MARKEVRVSGSWQGAILWASIYKEWDFHMCKIIQPTWTRVVASKQAIAQFSKPVNMPFICNSFSDTMYPKLLI